MGLLYPFKFQPVFKEKIWGGSKIREQLNMPDAPGMQCGEAWVLSGVPGSESVVTNGSMKGNTLNELVEVFMGDLVGEISNILAGDVAANVEKVGFRGQSSLPTATRGSDLTLFMPNKPPTKKMKFISENTEFLLTMVLSESN